MLLFLNFFSFLFSFVMFSLHLQFVFHLKNIISLLRVVLFLFCFIIYTFIFVFSLYHTLYHQIHLTHPDNTMIKSQAKVTVFILFLMIFVSICFFFCFLVWIRRQPLAHRVRVKMQAHCNTPIYPKKKEVLSPYWKLAFQPFTSLLILMT